MDTVPTPAGGDSRPTLPPLPGCGRPAVAQFELYSPRTSLHGSLDGDVYLCAEHADHDALRQASGLHPHQLPAPRAEGKRCGDGWDYLAMQALHAPEVTEAVERTDSEDPMAWCADAPEHEPCAERAEHQSREITVAPDVQATTLVTVQLVALISQPPLPTVYGVFIRITEEYVKRTFLLPLEQAAALWERLGEVVAWAGEIR